MKIKISDEIIDKFVVEEGLRQGCPEETKPI